MKKQQNQKLRLAFAFSLGFITLTSSLHAQAAPQQGPAPGAVNPNPSTIQHAGHGGKAPVYNAVAPTYSVTVPQTITVPQTYTVTVPQVIPTVTTTYVQTASPVYYYTSAYYQPSYYPTYGAYNWGYPATSFCGLGGYGGYGGWGGWGGYHGGYRGWGGYGRHHHHYRRYRGGHGCW